jgi:DNA-binding XRE family transcriptional regulator
MKKIRPDTLREKLSITQQYLAEYLAVSRTQLCLYEKGLRKLPPAAALKLAQMELACLQLQQAKTRKTGAPMHPHLQKHNEQTKKAMKQHAVTCSYKKKLLQRQLEKMAKEHAKAILLQDVLGTLTAAASKTKETSIDHLWIEVQQHEALKKMMRFGDVEQARLQAKIQSLEAEEAVYKRLHSKM